MSLKEWDRKYSILNDEIKVMIEKIGGNKFDESEKKLIKLQKELPKRENILAKNLSFISSQVSRNRFYSIQEKAIVHWAKKFSADAEKFYKDFSMMLNEVFWAKLVNIRNDCVVSHGEGFFFIDENISKHEVSKKHKMLLETRRNLRKKLDTLTHKAKILEHRYQLLSINKLNKESILNHKDLQLDDVFTFDQSHNKCNLNSMKLANLITNPIHAAHPLKGLTKESPGCRSPLHPIKSFDYLSLEDA
jgi:hypothetical protein